MEALLTLLVETSTTIRGGLPVEASFRNRKLFTSERCTFLFMGTRTTTLDLSRSTTKFCARLLFMEPLRTTLGSSAPGILICNSLSWMISTLYFAFSVRSTTRRNTLNLSTPQFTSVTVAAADAVHAVNRQTAQKRKAKNLLRKPVPPLRKILIQNRFDKASFIKMLKVPVSFRFQK